MLNNANLVERSTFCTVLEFPSMSTKLSRYDTERRDRHTNKTYLCFRLTHFEEAASGHWHLNAVLRSKSPPIPHSMSPNFRRNLHLLRLLRPPPFHSPRNSSHRPCSLVHYSAFPLQRHFQTIRRPSWNTGNIDFLNLQRWAECDKGFESEHVLFMQTHPRRPSTMTPKHITFVHRHCLQDIIVVPVERDAHSQRLEQTALSETISVHSELLKDLSETLSQSITCPPSLIINIHDEAQVDDVAECVDTLSMLLEGAKGVHCWSGTDVEADFIAVEEESLFKSVTGIYSNEL
jgi:hypothetical protein